MGIVTALQDETPMESQIKDALIVAIETGMEAVGRKGKSAHIISGGAEIADLVKERMEKVGINFENSPLNDAIKKHNAT